MPRFLRALPLWLPRLVAKVPATVHAKLLAAFLAIAMLLIILGAVGLQVLSGVNLRAEELVKLQQKIEAFHHLQRSTSLPSSWFWNTRTLEAARDQINQSLRDFDRLPAPAMGDADALARIRADQQQLAGTIDRLLDLTIAGKVAEGSDLLLTQAGPLAERLERLTNELVNSAETDMITRVDVSRDAYVRSRWIVIGYVVGSIGLALVLGYAISWSLIGPVTLLDARLRLLASGDFSQRVEVPNRDELGDLAAQFNRMAGQLHDSYANLEERTRELTEALDQQETTGDILRAILQSPADMQPVLDTVAESAARLCEAPDAAIFRCDGDRLRLVAHYGPIPYGTIGEFTIPLVRGVVLGRSVLEIRIIHVPDLPAEVDEFPEGSASARQWGHRTVLAVPLKREGVAIGAITLRRTEVHPFPEKHIALLGTFADQAAIAIENIRLFQELGSRTGELTRSVERLTALGEVGQALSSTLDVETVLDAIVSHASRLAGGAGCAIYEYDEAAAQFELRATHGYDAEFVEALRAAPLRKGEGLMGRAAEMREPAQVPDISQPASYQSSVRDALTRFGYRALLSVPLLREEQIIGSLSLTRKAPGEYPLEVIEVLKTFATQSALAIQNARLFREIADKSRQLEEASRHKSEFLANMSHELRTPLNAIIGFSEVLNDRMFGELNDKQAEYLEDIHGSGQHLLSLINDILDLSKVEAGRMELELEDFDLPSAVDNALTLVRERATRRGITLRSGMDNRLGMIQGDERKVKQVLLNLLSNALKFTPEGGRVDVRTVLRGGLAEVSVADTGVGIAAEDLEAVFEEFRQVGAGAAKQEGTGLGLALSRKFVELHGGKVWVESEPGRGSTFTFTLPTRAKASDPEARSAEATVKGAGQGANG